MAKQKSTPVKGHDRKVKAKFKIFAYEGLKDRTSTLTGRVLASLLVKLSLEAHTEAVSLSDIARELSCEPGEVAGALTDLQTCGLIDSRVDGWMQVSTILIGPVCVSVQADQLRLSSVEGGDKGAESEAREGEIDPEQAEKDGVDITPRRGRGRTAVG